MTPILGTAPVSTPVDLADLKAHLRVDHDDDDATLAALMASAVAHLDGWTGVLGRAIMPQTWKQEYTAWGSFRIAMPDVTDVVVKYCTEEVHGHSGNHVYETATDVTTVIDALGMLVTATGPATDHIIVEYTCAMPATLLPAAQNAVRLLVERDFDRPVGPAYDAITRTIDAQVSAIRWRRV